MLCREISRSAQHAAVCDVGPAKLESVDYQPITEPVPHSRREDVLDLWDTTPALSAHDINVSHFIRDGDEVDLRFYRQDWDRAAAADLMFGMIVFLPEVMGGYQQELGRTGDSKTKFTGKDVAIDEREQTAVDHKDTIIGDAFDWSDCFASGHVG